MFKSKEEEELKNKITFVQDPKSMLKRSSSGLQRPLQ